MKLTQIKPGELYERDWIKSTDVKGVHHSLHVPELYVMLWQDTKVHDNWMGAWVITRGEMIVWDDEPMLGAEFKLVSESNP